MAIIISFLKDVIANSRSCLVASSDRTVSKTLSGALGLCTVARFLSTAYFFKTFNIIQGRKFQGRLHPLLLPIFPLLSRVSFSKRPKS